jgi:hypothetical protein
VSWQADHSHPAIPPVRRSLAHSRARERRGDSPISGPPGATVGRCLTRYLLAHQGAVAARQANKTACHRDRVHSCLRSRGRPTTRCSRGPALCPRTPRKRRAAEPDRLGALRASSPNKAAGANCIPRTASDMASPFRRSARSPIGTLRVHPLCVRHLARALLSRVGVCRDSGSAHSDPRLNARNKPTRDALPR